MVEIRAQPRPVLQAISDREDEIAYMLAALNIDKAAYRAHLAAPVATSKHTPTPPLGAADAPALVPGW